MTENQIPNEYVKDKEIQITSFEYEKQRDPPRLVINTSVGRITCKPKKEVKEMVKGMAVISSSAMEVDEVADLLFRFNRIINEKSYVTVTASYVIMSKEVEGELMQYRFLNSIKQLEKWEIVASSSPTVTEVKPTKEQDEVEKAAQRVIQLYNKFKAGEITEEEYKEQVSKVGR